jgi:hypothetical protein
MMDELLKKLLEAEILSEDSKKELEEAVTTQIAEAVELAKQEAANTVRVELTEQWITERDALIEAIDTKVNEYLSEEIDELKHDISSFRDLEAEMATKIVEAKSEMSNELQSDLAELVEKLDAFLEIRLGAEMAELHEDIAEVKKIEFGRKVFESFVREYRSNFISEDSTEAELREAKEQVKTLQSKYEATESARDELRRTIKMESVLKPLNGKQRDIMETILKSVATDQLDEGYKTFIGRVIKEGAVTEVVENKGVSEKESTVLAEGSKISRKVMEGSMVVKTGDLDQEMIDEDDEEDVKVSPLTESMRRLAGLI